MDDTNNLRKQLNNPEREFSQSERKDRFKTESEPATENKEILAQEDKDAIMKDMMREIEMMSVDEKLKEEAENKVKKLQFLGDDKKLEHLLQIAKEKGVLFAIKVAKDMNDPYLLDAFHDLLANEGYYKSFIKQ